MAGKPDAKPDAPLRFTGGMHMLAPDYAIPPGFARDITNMDVTDDGVLRSRKGRAAAPRVSGTQCHSAWANAAMMIHADGANLKRTIGGTVTTMTAALRPGQPVCYAQLPTGDVVWSDGSTIGAFGPRDAVSRPLSLPNPGAPTLTSVSNGQLAAGTYSVALTYIGSDGIESPPSLPTAITVAEGQGIVLSGISAAPAGAIAVRAYMSHADDRILFDAAFIGAGTSTARIDSAPGGPPLETLFEAAFPPCSVLAFAAGYLIGARGDTVIWSEPHRYGVTRPTSNWRRYPATVSLIAPTQDGIYIGTLDGDGKGEAIFQPGFDLATQGMRQVTPYGAYPGTLANFPHTTDMAWGSPEGFVVASNGGQIQNISMAAVAFPGATRGGAIVWERDGLRQVVSALRLKGPDNPLTAFGYLANEKTKGV